MRVNHLKLEIAVKFKKQPESSRKTGTNFFIMF